MDDASIVYRLSSIVGRTSNESPPSCTSAYIHDAYGRYCVADRSRMRSPQLAIRSRNTMSKLPLLAITMGDPAGIGPEVVLKALRHADVYARCRPLVLGDRRILERAAPWVGATELEYELVEDPAGGHYRAGAVTLLDMANAAPEACPIGQISAEAGRAAVEYVFRACDLALAGATDAVVTAPLNKAAMNLAG